MPKVKALTPRQEDRRKRILTAARDMVADHGYEGMVMSQVAERAEVSPTTLYNLYNTKDQLVMESLRELLAENAQQVASSSDGPGWQFLYNSVKNGADMANTEPSYADAILVALQRARAGDELVTVLLEGNNIDIRRSLQAMAERDELKKGVDIEELAIAVNGVYWSSFIMWNKGFIRLQDLEHAILRNFLSIMIPSVSSETRKALEDRLEALG
jgi:AcrR family transcriptional regulator